MQYLTIAISDQDEEDLRLLASTRAWTGRKWTAEDLASAIVKGNLQRRRMAIRRAQEPQPKEVA